MKAVDIEIITTRIARVVQERMNTIALISTAIRNMEHSTRQSPKVVKVVLLSQDKIAL